MAQQTINIGSVANDGTGDPARTAFDKSNDNFDELYFSRSEYLHGYDYGLVHSDVTDQTTALKAAFAAASAAGPNKALMLAPGVYRYVGPIDMGIYPNLHLIGCAGTSYGTRLTQVGTSGLDFDGGAGFVFHCSMTNIMLVHEGANGSFFLRLQNAYSMRFTNIRFIKPTNSASICTSVVECDESNNDILFDSPCLQVHMGSGTRMPTGFLFKKNCGSIRLLRPDIEDCLNNIVWNGGNIEVISPYIETAAAYDFKLQPDVADTTASFKVFGGQCDYSNAAFGVAIFDNCHDVDFYGTRFIPVGTAGDIYVDGGTGVHGINFWGCTPNPLVFAASSVATSRRIVGIYGNRLVGSKTFDWGSIAALGVQTTTVTVTGAKLGQHSARANMSISNGGLILYAWVSADDTVSVSAFNPTGSGIDLASATLYVSVESMPDR